MNAVRSGGAKTATRETNPREKLSAAFIAAKSFLPISGRTENIAPMPAMWRSVSKAVMGMSREHSEMLYQASLSIAKSMLKQGIITDEEYAKIDAFLIKKYNPYIGKLLSKNT